MLRRTIKQIRRKNILKCELIFSAYLVLPLEDISIDI